MNPVAFEIFGMQIRWYGIIIACGVLAAFGVTYITAKKKNLNFDIIIDGFLWSFPLAIIGARVYYVIFEFKNYNSIWEMINIRNGGIAIHGGLIAGLLTAYVFTKVKKINFLEYIDVVMPGIILAQAIGRWGNFMNQEAHGGPVTEQFISKFPHFIQQGMLINGTYYHPTFLYESIATFTIFIIFWPVAFNPPAFSTIGAFIKESERKLTLPLHALQISLPIPECPIPMSLIKFFSATSLL